MSDFPPQGEGIGASELIVPQYLEVALSNKEYTSIKTAIDSITDASTTKPYIIKVYPGVYTESPFSMKANVSIEGTSYYSTIIETNDNSNHFITGASRSQIRNVVITGPIDVGKAAVYYTGTGTTPFIMQDVLIRKGYYGVWANSPSLGTVHLINVNNWYVGTAMHTFIRTTDHSNITAVSSGFMCGSADAITKGFEANGVNSEIYLDLCYFRNTPSAKTIVGLYIDNGAYAKINACTFSRGTYAIQIGPSTSNGYGGNVYATSCIIRNDSTYFFTTDIKIDNALAKMDYNGVASRTKLSITSGATFTGLFNDITTGAPGSINLGEFYIGDLDNQLPLRDYGYATYLTGQNTGGEVTSTGGLTVHIANGAGFINTSPTVDAVKAITWFDTDLNITANTRQWIYVTSSGTVTKSSTKPNENTNITLAVAYANATTVVFLAFYTRLLQHIIGNIFEYSEDGMGPIWVSGLNITENATPLKLNVSSGEYFITPHAQSPVGASPITFTYWYGSDAGGWTTVTSSTAIDVTNYDSSGVLTALSANKWKKDVLYVNVNSNSSTTQYHIVYGQEQFDTQAGAENGDNPIPPSFLSTYALKLAGIIVQKGTSNINEILDIKPTGYFIKPGHNTLPGLQGGNSASSQYFHLNSTQHANVDQKILASIAGNTTGTGSALISSGTMYISGGNNITLSQDGSSIGLIAGMSVSADVLTNMSTVIKFGNSNDISFKISNGSVIGSYTGLHGLVVSNSISNATTIGTSGTVSFAGTNVTITAAANNSILGFSVANQAAAQESNWINLQGNTNAASNSTASGSTIMWSAGNNVTLAATNDSVIKIIAAGPTDIAIGAIGFANTDESNSNKYNTGSVIFSGQTNLTVNTSVNGASQYLLLSAKDPTSAGIGAIGFANTNESNSNKYNTGSVIFSGQTNLTVNTSVNGASQYLLLSGPNIVNASIAGNTTGTGSTIISSGTMYVSGGNNITLSQDGSSIGLIAGMSVSADVLTNMSTVIKFGNSNDISFKISNGSVIGSYTGLHGLVVSNSISNATTIGTSGTVSFAGTNVTITAAANNSILGFSVADPGAIVALGNIASSNAFSSGTIAFSGQSNITVNTSATSNSQYIQFSVADPGILSVFAGTTRVTSGEVIFSNANDISFGANGQTITASMVDRYNILAAGTQTANISDTVFFSNSNSISFGMSNSSIITASIGMIAPTIYVFDNFKGIQLDRQGTASDNLSLQRIYVPGYITATEFEIIAAMSGTTKSAGSATLSAAIYTMTSATANMASSASTIISWTSGSAASSNQYGGRSGTQYREIFNATSVMNWNVTPGEYLIGVIWRTGGAGSWTFYGMSSLSMNAHLGSINHAHIFGDGLYSATTNAFPSAIQSNELIQTGASVLRQPWFRLGGAF